MTDENQPDSQTGYRHARWTEHFDEIDREIAQLASLCKIRLLDPGVIERVLKKDTLVCGTQNPRAFDKLRSLLMMHYSVRDRAVVALGEDRDQAHHGRDRRTPARALRRPSGRPRDLNRSSCAPPGPRRGRQRQAAAAAGGSRPLLDGVTLALEAGRPRLGEPGLLLLRGCLLLLLRLLSRGGVLPRGHASAMCGSLAPRQGRPGI